MNYKLILALMSIIGTTRAQNLIDTTYGEGAGSFELPGFATADGYITLADGSTAITGWTVDQAALDWVAPAYWNPSDGIFSLDLNGFFVAGGIHTTIPTIPGTSYGVSFDLAGFVATGSPSNPKSVEVSVGTSTKSFSMPVPTVTGQKPITVNWTQHRFDFVASTTSSTLSFRSLVPGDASGLLLDNVSVQKVVPRSVTNVKSRQIPGTHKVEITYMLESATPCTIAVLYSMNGGSTVVPLPPESLPADWNPNVTGGTTPKLIEVDAAKVPLLAKVFTKQLCFRLTASDAQPVPEGFALIQAGSFQMGDTLGDGYSDELPVHTVQVSAFYMAKYEVTKALWDEVREWGSSHGYTDLPIGGGKAATHPVHSVTWYDMVKWCNARSEKDGLTPCYTVYGAKYRTGISEPECNWNARSYRLPTEAEWEKSARGGIIGKRFPWGDTINHLFANYHNGDNSYEFPQNQGYHPTYATGGYPYTSPVGSFAANGYGLYDMAGNVWEWCWDWHGSYPSTTQTDPRGPESGSLRARRGGNWYFSALSCRVADRGGVDYPDGFYNFMGFRIALSAVP